MSGETTKIPTSQVEAKLQRIIDANTEAQRLVNRLEERLHGVLSSRAIAPEEVDTDAKEAKVLVPLAEDMDKEATALFNTLDHLESVIDRIEI
jgi:hypothetical protein